MIWKKVFSLPINSPRQRRHGAGKGAHRGDASSRTADQDRLNRAEPLPGQEVKTSKVKALSAMGPTMRPKSVIWFHERPDAVEMIHEWEQARR